MSGMRRRPALLAAAVLLASVAAALPAGAVPPGPRVAAVPATAPARVLAATPAAVTGTAPLAGLVIALDPGHQLGNGNRRFARQLAQKRWNGYITKGCNTTGTATNRGYPEATFTWNVAVRLRARLEALGATVRMTRTANSRNLWGPCTWDRGKFGAKVGAALEVSIHGDGAPSSGRGFHVIAPARLRGWTDDVYVRANRLADAMIAGMTAAGATPSTYIRGHKTVRKDQNTLNFSDVPTVIVELGNMRNATDAARMTSSRGQDQYAAWLLAGIRRYLAR